MKRKISLFFMAAMLAALTGLLCGGGREARAAADLATVCVDDWCGYVDDQGQWAITPRFAAADPFSREGTAWVILSDEQRDQGRTPAPSSSLKKIGLINTRGDLVNPAAVFSQVKPFTAQGLAAAQAARGRGQGFIDRRGLWVIEPKFDKVWSFADNGLAKVTSGGHSGFINSKGQWGIEPRFDFVWPFSPNGLAAACAAKPSARKEAVHRDSGRLHCQWGFINGQGRWAVEPQFEDAEPFAGNGLAKVKLRGKWGYINAKGQWIFEPQFEYAELGSFGGNGLAKAARGGKWGLINTSGQWVAEPQFGYIYPFAKNGLATAYSNSASKTGFIDQQGRWAIEPQFSDAGSFSDNGLARVRIYSKSGFINARGEWIDAAADSRPQGGFAKNGLAAAQGRGGWGYLDATGQWGIEAQFGYAHDFSDDGLAIVSAPGRHEFGVINSEGRWIVEPKFERLESAFFSAKGSNKIHDRWAHINWQGQWLSEFLYGDWVKSMLGGSLMKGDLNVRSRKVYRTGVWVDAQGLYRTGLDDNPREPAFRWEFGDGERSLFNRRGEKILSVLKVCETEIVKNGEGQTIWPLGELSDPCEEYELVTE